MVGWRRAKHKVVGVVEAKADDVPIFQNAPVDFLAVDKDAPLVPHILENVAAFLRDNGRAPPGNAPVGQGKIALLATTDGKR
jgi:hypothetical protein